MYFSLLVPMLSEAKLVPHANDATQVSSASLAQPLNANFAANVFGLSDSHAV